jgi:hypothetical protein
MVDSAGSVVGGAVVTIFRTRRILAARLLESLGVVAAAAQLLAWPGPVSMDSIDVGMRG